MEKKFNVGDKVTYLPDDMQGEITAVHSRGLYGVKYPDEDDSFTVNEADLEFAGPKTAFLTRLRDLLAEFNASIMLDAKGSYCGDDVESVTMSICFNNEHIDYTITDFDKEITADSIMEYDKE